MHYYSICRCTSITLIFKYIATYLRISHDYAIGRQKSDLNEYGITQEYNDHSHLPHETSYWIHIERCSKNSPLCSTLIRQIIFTLCKGRRARFTNQSIECTPNRETFTDISPSEGNMKICHYFSVTLYRQQHHRSPLRGIRHF